MAKERIACVTVDEALQLQVLSTSKLLTDSEMAKEREIARVSVIKVPIGQFVRPGSLS